MKFHFEIKEEQGKGTADVLMPLDDWFFFPLNLGDLQSDAMYSPTSGASEDIPTTLRAAGIHCRQRIRTEHSWQ